MKRYFGIVSGVLFCFVSAFSQPVCPVFNSGVSLGNVAQSALGEVSGIAASRQFANVLWAHNDSGDTARVFAMKTDGTHLGTFNITGASAVDWEDMAIGPGPAGPNYLYLSDTGNNALNRSVVTVYRIPEPALTTYTLPVQTSLSGVEAFPMQYPSNQRHDAETLLVDPIHGDMLIVTRDRSKTGTTYVFLYRAPLKPGVLVTLELVATLASSIEITGGDVSQSGESVLLRPFSFTQSVQGMFWRRTPGTPLYSVFAASPCAVPLVLETQGEAIAFTPDGAGYYTTSEGAAQPIYYYGQPLPPAAPSGVGATALSATQVRVSWIDNANNEGGFRIERSTDGNTFAQIASLGANATSYTDSTVLAATTYWYRIIAFNDAGWSATDGQSRVTTPAAITKPNAPTGLIATANSTSQITIQWVDASSNETGFKIERSTNGFSFSQIATTGANITSFKNTGLTANRLYYYRVRATNSAGNSSYSKTVSVRTPQA